MTADVDDGGRAEEGRGMRLLHTADWHLGRALHGASLLEDQARLLDQLVLRRSRGAELLTIGTHCLRIGQ